MIFHPRVLNGRPSHLTLFCYGFTFFLADPILRPKLDWYHATLDIVRKEIWDILQGLDITNISRSDVMSRASQLFDPDLVHLTTASGKIFVEGILEAA